MMAVAETAGNCSKTPSGTSKASRRSSNCTKTAKSDGFTLSKVPLAQWIRAQAAPDLILFVNPAHIQFNLVAAKNVCSKGKGSSNAQDTSFTNTDISAGNTATIKSGGDTNVIGATVQANQIKADVGGSLSIESLQNKSSYTSSQKSMGASISIPITGSGSAGGSVSASKSNVESNLQSVGQQSGLKAGDGGFRSV